VLWLFISVLIERTRMYTRAPFLHVSLVALLPFLAGAAANAQQYTATLFGPADGIEVKVNGAGNGRQVGTVSTEANGFATHATLWLGPSGEPIDLNPAGAASSVAYGCGGLQQVGSADTDAGTVAVLWTGSAASAVVLNPAGFGTATASATDGVTQVGSGRGPNTGRGPHALAWLGTAASAVDLHPDGHLQSAATGVDGSWVCGAAFDDFGGREAGYWTALDPQAWVSLHPTEGFDVSTAQAVGGTSIGGWGRGAATGGATHALLWLAGGETLLDLHPAGFVDSYVYAVRGGVQAGSATFFGGGERAVVWAGTAESAIDLHDLTPGGPWAESRVTSIDTDGSLYGYVSNGGNAVAVRWTPAAAVCGPADVGGPGGAPGADGLLNNNDFVVFIDLFFSHAPAADMGGTGGVAGADGSFDNNDFVVFIDRFFAGC
jgi:hypothetical protein